MEHPYLFFIKLCELIGLGHFAHAYPHVIYSWVIMMVLILLAAIAAKNIRMIPVVEIGCRHYGAIAVLHEHETTVVRCHSRPGQQFPAGRRQTRVEVAPPVHLPLAQVQESVQRQSSLSSSAESSSAVSPFGAKP